MSALREKVADFLFEEAARADAHDYAGWLELWAEECLYWIPCNDDDIDPETHISIVYETRVGLQDRVRRLGGGYAHSQLPPHRLSRVIGNIRVSEIEDGLVEARSTFNLTAFRRDRFEIFAGRMVHRLRSEGDDFRIVRKIVYLVNNDGYMSNMTFLM